MTLHDFEADKTLADDQDALEPLDAWNLNDFDDLLYGVKRSIAPSSAAEEYGYASES
jgi:hypothetical protein